MNELDKIGKDLFNKIRGRFPKVTIGDEDGNITNEPEQARFFDFEFNEGDRTLGKVSVSIDEEEGLAVIFSKDFIEDQDDLTQKHWYSFLKELRVFSKKRMMGFSVRDITKSNLDKRDYKFLAANRSGDDQMTESKLYGTHKMSYQDVDSARLVIKHTESIDQERPSTRSSKVGAIYIENSEGERFKYPFKHLSGARAMARHVAEGGKPFDDFGNHITGLSEEISKLRKFKTHMGRNSVMAEGLAGYMDIVKERLSTVKKRLEHLQKPSFYKEEYDSFEVPVMEEVPEDVRANWIDELTIKQFNEDLKDVFPYIYNLIGEATRTKDLSPEDFMNEAAGCPCNVPAGGKCTCPKDCKDCNCKDSEEDEVEEGFGRKFNKVMNWGMTSPEKIKKKVRTMSDEDLKKLAGSMKDAKAGSGSERSLQIKLINQELKRRYGIKPGKDVSEDEDPCWDDYKQVGMKKKGGKKVPNCVPKEEMEIESYFNQLMGEWADDEACCDGCESGGECEKDDKEVNEIAKDDLVDKILKNPKYMKKSDGTESELANNLERYKVARQELQNELTDPNPDRDLIDEYRRVKEKLGKNIENIINQIKKGKPAAEDEENDIGKQQSPLSEFILSFYDRANGSFPKGETAVLTMVEKDYGDEYIEPAKQFIEQVNQTFEQYQARQTQQAPIESGTEEFERIRSLAGL